ncbi:DUF3107 domain-containing protein [uncultured Tessaracoccus sp.]|uniref:DUF3107 domain-containing protein n=1 Tax=uncultured Tessaracoccus sp. TaxID=905023 RepID=UPI002637B078|nr:DUF3107 domain-containing protein [uncultured Tessaracoccus sp.]
MEIKLGIAHVAREIALETQESPDEISNRLASAVESNGIFELADDKGRKILIPADRVGYVELGSPNARPVGFGRV